MKKIEQNFTCVSIDPRLYLIVEDDLDDIIDKVTDLYEVFENIKDSSNTKFLYNGNLDHVFDAINLFNYHMNDAVFLDLRRMIEEYKEKIEKVYPPEEEINCSFFNFSNDINKTIYATLDEQYSTYHNSLIVGKTKENFLFNEVTYYIENSLATANMSLKSLKEITENNFDDISYIYQWFFDKDFQFNIVICNSVFDKIDTLEAGFYSTIISLFRSMYFPDYLLKQVGANRNTYTIECHPASQDKFYCCNRQLTPYRVHVISTLTNLSSASDRLFYIKDDNCHIFIGINHEHDFKENITKEEAEQILSFF